MKRGTSRGRSRSCNNKWKRRKKGATVQAEKLQLLVNREGRAVLIAEQLGGRYNNEVIEEEDGCKERKKCAGGAIMSDREERRVQQWKERKKCAEGAIMSDREEREVQREEEVSRRCNYEWWRRKKDVRRGRSR
jgi:hypothetical protein